MSVLCCLLFLAVATIVLRSPESALAEKDRTVKLKPAKLDDPWRVPARAELQLTGVAAQFGTSPARVALKRLVQGRVDRRDKKNRLPVSPHKKDGTQKWLDPKKAHKVTWVTPDRKVPLLFYAKEDDWFVASAALLEGNIKKEHVVLLDGDADGAFFGPEDHIRSGPGAFRPVTDRTLVLLSSGLWRVEMEAGAQQLELSAVERPDDVGTRPWRALRTVNEFRSGIGVPLMMLHKRKTEASQLHAKYLYLNKDDPVNTPVDETHNEIEGRPGYTKLGHEAALQAGMDYKNDAAAAIETLLRTLLHRRSFMGSATEDIGIGVVDGSLISGVPGYTVVWGAKPQVKDGELPLCVPGPGQANVVREGHGELPRVEKHPDLFDQPRGYPIAVYFGEMKLEEIQVRVSQLVGKRYREVPGLTFTPAEPVTSSRPTNHHAAFFVAESKFESETRYRVVFEAKRETENVAPQPVRLIWDFQTAR